MTILLELLVYVLSFLSLSLAAPNAASGRSRIKELIAHPRGWVKGDPAPANYIISLRIALPQPNFHVLEQHLYEVSDPAHTRYGQHLSKQEVEVLVAPASESIEIVDEWLVSHGLNVDDFAHSPARDWIEIKVPVSLAEVMLNTEYHIWTHEESGDSSIRTLSYSVPEHIHDHVDLIQPTTWFARMKKQKTTFRWSNQQDVVSPPVNNSKITLPSGISVDASCNTTVTITCLKQLYNAVGFNASATNGNKIGITAYLGQFANIEDLQLFYADQRPDALNTSFNFVSVNGGQNIQNVSEAGDEADLDVEFAFGLTFPTPSTFWSTAGMPPFIPDIQTPTDTNEPYTTWLDFILAQDDIPQTISTSYSDNEQTVPESFARRVCNGFAQLGARGVSLMFGSGDGGVGDGDPDPATQECITNDGRNLTKFMPGFPASCPFVTAVGGTIFIPEVAVDFSGGGFSNFFARPAYQDTVVQAYLAAIPEGTFAGLFNPNGRAIPDVSALADNFRIFFRGQAALIGGTSASSPTFAGFVSLLNDARLSNGLPPLGFLNPFIYSQGQAGLTDITIGNNPGCGTQGFNATVGWDPVTGFGTPNFEKLKELVLQNGPQNWLRCIVLQVCSSNIEVDAHANVMFSVREHFSSPLLQFADADGGQTFTLVECPSGTGQLIARLADDEIDVAIALTDPLIAGIAKGSSAYKLVGSYVSTPLNWAVITGKDSKYNSIQDLKDTTIGISRPGSGSQTMASVMALQQGWDPESVDFKVNNDIHGLIASVNDGSTSAFMWEWFTTKPFRDSGDVRFIGSVPTPWPSWLIAAHPSSTRAPPAVLRVFLTTLSEHVRAFDAPSAREEADVRFIKERFGYPETDIREWLKTVGYPTDCAAIPEDAVLETSVTLVKAGVIHKPEYGYVIDDFVNKEICKLI
ncbi:hypothetical protein EW145_g4490 [Phellinidium pouzarii]|uniref:tripeptidyl-peptidase II n=1 Tax=Phellinidium pouzarii TaxID=167371 RepID=A0A4V3XCH5_9AGAM|nr:hypothetical protein EW145_g4490 [Phellinidium pouzarii]